MIGPGTGVRVYLACGITDMRKGIEVSFCEMIQKPSPPIPVMCG
jgi:hypothetical protein